MRMRDTCLLSGLLSLCFVAGLRAESDQFHVRFWIRTEATSDRLPAIVTDKDWNSGSLIDVTSHHDLGLTRDSGSLRGFCIALAPQGSWAFNLGDGKNRLDYRATKPRQPINDGRWHQLAFSIDRPRSEAHLFHDGRRVAIFSLTGMGDLTGALRAQIEADAIGPSALFDGEIEDLVIADGPLDPALVQSSWRERNRIDPPRAARPQRRSELRVLAWNIWHGGRRDGDQAGIERTIQVIRESGADVVAMQETYGSGAAIADGLGFHYYLRSSNLSVMSRYPIVATHDLYQPFRFGGVTLELAPGQRVKLFSLWINHLPDYGEQMTGDQPLTAAELVDADRKIRGKEIDGILATLTEVIAASDVEPLIIAGDFNSPSHLDWTAATSDLHRDLVVAWPVSVAMERAGFRDAYRRVHPDPRTRPGRTWSPRFRESWQDRIDYIYFQGKGVRATQARMLDELDPRWPSDHAAVLATLQLP